MSEEKDKVDKLKGKQLSRREFLKDAGLVAGGAAVGSMAILSACGTETTITKTNTATTTLTSTATSSMTTTVTAPGSTITQPATTVTVEKVVEVVKLVSVPKSGYIEWNPDECASCSRCLMACAAYKQKAVAMQLSSIRWEDNDEFHGFRFRRPLFCQQCPPPSVITPVVRSKISLSRLMKKPGRDISTRKNASVAVFAWQPVRSKLRVSISMKKTKKPSNATCARTEPEDRYVLRSVRARPLSMLPRRKESDERICW